MRYTPGFGLTDLRTVAEQDRNRLLTTHNGGTDPYPIPWLDKNGSHNLSGWPTVGAVAHLPKVCR
jgi:hypothetical protein